MRAGESRSRVVHWTMVYLDKAGWLFGKIGGQKKEACSKVVGQGEKWNVTRVM